MDRPLPTWDHPRLQPLASAPVIGIDEVGRGAWAGPVVAGAVILPWGLQLNDLADSKLVPPARRLMLDRLIRRSATVIGLGWVSAAEVDTQGLTWAVRQSGLRALADLALACDYQSAVVSTPAIILDGRHNYLKDTHPSIAIVKADSLITPVAAASIVAKVARDRYMQMLARLHPGYAFERHVGYGTTAHRTALSLLGLCPHHRRSFAPLKNYQFRGGIK